MKTYTKTKWYRHPIRTFRAWYFKYRVMRGLQQARRQFRYVDALMKRARLERRIRRTHWQELIKSINTYDVCEKEGHNG